MATFNAQDWVNTNIKDKTLRKLLLSTSEKDEIWNKEMIGVGGKLTGDLTLDSYPNLEEIEIEDHELTSLTISNCPNLRNLNVRENKLTKLDIKSGEQLKEIIASDNKLISLDLTNCQQVKELLVSENPDLKELKNLNQNVLDNFNKVNTQIDLNKEERELIAKNNALLDFIKGVNEMGKEHELILVEPIFTPEQNKEAITRLLTRTRDRWTEYIESEEPAEVLAEKFPMIHLAFRIPQVRAKAERILLVINGVIENNNTPKELLKEWNGDEDENNPYNPLHDYDMALLGYISHLRSFKPLIAMTQEHVVAEPVFYDFNYDQYHEPRPIK